MLAFEVMKGVKDTPFCGVEPSRHRCTTCGRGGTCGRRSGVGGRGAKLSLLEVIIIRSGSAEGTEAHPPLYSLSSFFFYNDRRSRLLL